jgi:predicted house-cleaning noncanonical NTP pyrophosphatase (MazG superfamily)
MSARLVRDRIGELSWKFEDAKQGLRPTVDREEHLRLIRQKLLEEVAEFLAATSEQESFEEAADIFQVIIDMIGINMPNWGGTELLAAVDDIRLKKLTERGGFSQGTVWEI